MSVLNEPRRVVDLGAPDYDVRSGQGLLGRIEVKDLHAPLGTIEEDSNRAAPTTDEGRQLKRYRARIDNLIFSDYNEIRWYRNGQRIGPPVRLAAVDTAGALAPEPTEAVAAPAVLRDFLAVEPITATSAEELAERMASLALLVRHIIEESFRQGVASQDLRDLKSQVDQNLLAGQSDDDFADMVAQTLAYGLFAARVHQHGSGQDEFDRTRAAALVPRTNPFLRSLLHLLFNGLDFDQQPYAGFSNDLVEVLARADMEQVLRGFADRTTPEHPVVHFYETFLGKYNPQERERRGVYYPRRRSSPASSVPSTRSCATRTASVSPTGSPATAAATVGTRFSSWTPPAGPGRSWSTSSRASATTSFGTPACGPATSRTTCCRGCSGSSASWPRTPSRTCTCPPSWRATTWTTPPVGPSAWTWTA